MRWRSISPNRREQVMEITAWYDGLGYEYTVVDGLPFADAKGRLRLQEIPEGTIVQWTFTYEPKGIAGNLRSRLSARRRIEGTMVESLRSLWRYINQSGGAQHAHEAKSLMRDALDYEARANYKPRHPSAFEARSTQRDKPATTIFEPPLSDEDTRPRIALQLEVVDNQDAAINQDVEHKAEHEEAAMASSHLAQIVSDTTEDASISMPLLQETLAASPALAPALDVDEREPTVAIEEEPQQSALGTAANYGEINTSISARTGHETASMPSAAALDTSQLSIWEIFGIPRPSEIEKVSRPESAPLTSQSDVSAASQQHSPQTEADAASFEPTVTTIATVTGVNTPSAALADLLPQTAAPVQLAALLGWRAMQRRKLVNLRRR